MAVFLNSGVIKTVEKGGERLGVLVMSHGLTFL